MGHNTLPLYWFKCCTYRRTNKDVERGKHHPVLTMLACGRYSIKAPLCLSSEHLLSVSSCSCLNLQQLIHDRSNIEDDRNPRALLDEEHHVRYTSSLRRITSCGLLWSFILKDRIHVTGGFFSFSVNVCSCSHIYNNVKYRSTHTAHTNRELALCVSKCERTWDKDIRCLCAASCQKTLTRPNGGQICRFVTRTSLFSWGHVCVFFSFFNHTLTDGSANGAPGFQVCVISVWKPQPHNFEWSGLFRVDPLKSKCDSFSY